MPQRLPLLSSATQSDLEDSAHRLRGLPLRDLLDADPDRAAGFAASAAGLVLDYSRQRLDARARAALLAAARESGLTEAIEAMFRGALVNHTEGRPALHTALRAGAGAEPLSVGGTDVRRAVSSERERCRQFVAGLLSGTRRGATGERISDVVNIGIGGSDLGPVMALEALRSFVGPRVRVHFASNVDGTQLADLCAELEPARTLFIVCSKTFTTQETLANARLARRFIADKLGQAAVPRHFAAVSVNGPAMDEFGVGADARFAMWDWVGGRYSLWSAIGLAVEVGIGSARFDEFLAGGAAMDAHFRTAPFEGNLPVLHGLLSVWNRNFLELDSHCILPYDQRLNRFPSYLQQLMMESNGKGVRRSGEPVTCDTGAVIWGEPGSNSQHSFFQLLHQGAARFAMDFILPASSSVRQPDSHGLAVANCLAQAEAFARGYTAEEAEHELRSRGLSDDRVRDLVPHKVHPGNRPGSILMFAALTPATLGALVALYEHSVYVASVLWDINPFDQWGVELGKRLADSLLPAAQGSAEATGRLATALQQLAVLGQATAS
jgi:glucose-6-phosphate isomerase